MSAKRLMASLAIVVGIGAGALAQAAPAFADGYSGGDAAAFVADINALRAAHGLGALAVNSSLVSMADGWAVHLAGVGSLSHNPNLAGEAPAGWRLLGENVGVGGGVASLQAAFTASPEHFANMVDPKFSEIGVGVYVSSQGYLWVTEDYMEPPAAAAVVVRTPAPTPSPAPAPAAVRPVTFSTPAPVPVHTVPVHTVPVQAAPVPSAPVIPVSTPTPAPAAAATRPATPVVPAPASVPSAAPVSAVSAPSAPTLPPARPHLSTADKAQASPPVSAGITRRGTVGWGQAAVEAVRSLSPARAAVLILLPLAGLAWLTVPRRRLPSARAGWASR